jgi:glutaconyl-CoA decarboxylase subunit alpha
MKPYFEKMNLFGSVLPAGKIKSGETNVQRIQAAEAVVDEAVAKVKNAGLPEKVINQRGQLTVWQRLEYLVDPGSWNPLNTLYNPHDNVEGTNNVCHGLAKISGKWAVVIGFDNKVIAGAWIPGQAEEVFRATNLSKRLNLPLVWLVNCSGVKLTEQEKFYANRRGGGTTFFPSRRAGADGHSDPGRHLRDQPGRRRLPEHQPHYPFCP